jgi:tetratricopeptide (TPR) repeat protein
VGAWQHEYALYYDRVAQDVIYNEQVRLIRLHNSYLEFFANVGLVGFSFLLILAGMVGKIAHKLLAHKNTKTRQLNIVLVLALIGFSVNAIFSFPLRVFFPGVLVMSFVALIVVLFKQDNPTSFKLSFGFGKLLLMPLVMLSFIFAWNAYNRIMSTHYDNLSEKISTLGASSQAFKTALVALSYAPDNYQTLLLLARTSFNIGKTTAAIELLERVHRLNPRFDRALLALSLAYGRSGQIEKAIESLKKLLALDPRKIKAHAMMVRAYLSQGDFKNAKKHHKLMLKWQIYFADRQGFGANENIVKQTSVIFNDFIVNQSSEFSLKN